MDLDRLKVIGASLTAVTISIHDVEAILSVVSLLLAAGYTIWKWRKEMKENKG